MSSPSIPDGEPGGSDVTLSLTSQKSSQHSSPSVLSRQSAPNHEHSPAGSASLHTIMGKTNTERYSSRPSSVFAETKQGRARSIIFGAFASQEYNIMRTSIRLFPLCFISSSDESKFYSRILQSFYIRARFSAMSTFVLYGLYWICVAICLANKTFPCAGTHAQIAFSLCMGTMTLCSFLPYIGSSFMMFEKFTEISVYIVVLTASTLVSGWMILNAALEDGNNPNAVVQFQRTKVWVNIFFYVVPFWNCMLMDIVMQARTRTSFIVHILNFLIFTIASSVQTAIAVSKSRGSEEMDPQQDELMIVLALTECFLIFCTSLFLYVGRWFLELQERIEFLKRMRATEHVRRLREQRAKKKRKKGATVIEDVLSTVEKIIANVDEVLVESNLPSLAEGAELLRQCEQILTETDNLYSVRYQAKGRGDEGAIEEQFFSMYAERQLQRLSTRVRFGEVTGIHFESSAAPVDILKSGQLNAPQTLRSFGLLHLHDPTRKGLVIDSGIQLKMDNSDVQRIGRDWETDILKLSETHSNILLEVGVALLHAKIEAVRTPPSCLANYLKKLQDTYPPNPYHNQVHGATVAHATSCLMRMLCIYEAADHSNVNDIAVIIAALGHDAAHPGRSNLFFVNSCDPLALLYSDASVLENAHSAITFKCLECASCNVFADVSPDLFRNIRKRIIDLILATDMGQHFEAISRFRLRRQAAGFNYLEDLEDMWHVIRMCLKCADLSHALVDWNQHLDWSLRVAEEFYQQGDHEAALGLKVSPFCDRSQHSGLPRSQKGFLEFVVQPLITQMEELEHGTLIGIECVSRLTHNKSKWEELVKSERTVPRPEGTQVSDPMHCLKTLVSLYSEGQHLVPKQQRKRSLEQSESGEMDGSRRGGEEASQETTRNAHNEAESDNRTEV